MRANNSFFLPICCGKGGVRSRRLSYDVCSFVAWVSCAYITAEAGRWADTIRNQHHRNVFGRGWRAKVAVCLISAAAAVGDE